MKTKSMSLAAILGLVLGATPSMAHAAEPSETVPAGQCELHIWPTQSYYAVFHGAEPYAGGLQMYLSPMEDTKQKLSRSISPAQEETAIRKIDRQALGKYADYKLIFHPAPPAGQSKYANWIEKGVAEGSRDTDSRSPCYAEVHVIFITLFRTALSKKIQTGFIFRGFGGSQTTEVTLATAGSTGAPAFPAGGGEVTPQAVLDLQAAFKENFEILLRKGKVKK